MATFQEWWDENYGEFSGQSVQSKIKMRMAYDVGVEHQLTKVDEQQKRIDELQARVDAALKIADELEQSFEMYKTGIELRKILQGGGEV